MHRTQGNIQFSRLLKDMIKDTRELPDEEGHRRSGGVPSMGVGAHDHAGVDVFTSPKAL